MSSTVQIVTIAELNQLSQLGNNDFLIVYDSASLTWKKISKSNIQLDMAVHNNSSHSTPFLISASNLSDLTNVSEARTNLGLHNTLDKTENLADLTNITEAQINLNLSPTHIRTQGNYIVLDSNTTLQVGKKYIIKENVTALLPTTLSIGDEIEIVSGVSFGDSDVLNSYINLNGKKLEGSSSSPITMTKTSFRLIWTGTDYGWSRI